MYIYYYKHTSKIKNETLKFKNLELHGIKHGC